MILQNDIMGILLNEISLDMKSLNKIVFLNNEHADYMEKYFKNIYIKKVLPDINLIAYINNYHSCTKCYQLTANLNYVDNYSIKGLCNNCIDDIEMCDECGLYKERKNLHFRPRSIRCKDVCIFYCTICQKEFNNIDDVECLSDYTFVCYPCYVQESAILRYKKRKTSQITS